MRGEGKAALDQHRVAVRSPTSPASATAEGYERAMAFRERLGIAPQMELRGECDLEEVLLPRLGIVLRELTLQDPRVEALCIAGGGYRPAIAINIAGKFSNTSWGRRMSVAHELCHLLQDGDAAGRTGIVSNPWAPPLIERRANAFAVMLLAPEEALKELLSADARRWSRHDLDRDGAARDRGDDAALALEEPAVDLGRGADAVDGAVDLEEVGVATAPPQVGRRYF